MGDERRKWCHLKPVSREYATAKNTLVRSTLAFAFSVRRLSTLGVRCFGETYRSVFSNPLSSNLNSLTPLDAGATYKDELEVQQCCWSTEAEAKEQKLDYDKGVFPWLASGRSLGVGRSEGIRLG